MTIREFCAAPYRPNDNPKQKNCVHFIKYFEFLSVNYVVGIFILCNNGSLFFIDKADEFSYGDR